VGKPTMITTDGDVASSPRRSDPLLHGLAEDTEVVCATNLADLVGRKACLQHGIDYDVVEASSLICPREIRAFSDPRLVLARAEV
jgi:hypothetical protein